jgi:outer membrane receptor for ferric coprogen and ferric-rhodotorulic acid
VAGESHHKIKETTLENENRRGARAARKPLALLVALAAANWTMHAQAQAQSERAEEAQAAQPAPAAPGQLQTVLVTANKRVEKLESVPMSISVLSEQQLLQNNVREIEDVINLTPSLTLSSGAASVPFPSASAWNRMCRSSSTTSRSPASSRPSATWPTWPASRC